jgi:glycosyltransferase involved in cell wall biosynthesis
MACGVPLVQPRRGAFTEIVESTGGGILVRPDDPADLAAGILKIARDRKLAEELGANGFRGVREHYSAAHMDDRLLEAYASVRQPPESVVSEVGEVRLARG